MMWMKDFVINKQGWRGPASGICRQSSVYKTTWWWKLSCFLGNQHSYVLTAEVEVTPYMRAAGRCGWCALGQRRRQMRVYGLGLEGRLTWVTLWWVAATRHLIGGKRRWGLLHIIGRNLYLQALVLRGHLNHLLEGQHSRAQAVQEISGVHWC